METARDRVITPGAFSGDTKGLKILSKAALIWLGEGEGGELVLVVASGGQEARILV